MLIIPGATGGGLAVRFAHGTAETVEAVRAVGAARKAGEAVQAGLKSGQVLNAVQNANGGEGGEGGRGRQLGERMKEGDDPVQQLEEIENAQNLVRKGKSKQIIDSTGKSQQQMRHHLSRIKRLTDSVE